MSNRSLAAARSRRSPQEVVSESSMKKNQQMPQQRPVLAPPQVTPSSKNMASSSSNSGPQTSSNKLSISDAIGLITIRLSKLESHMLKDSSENLSSNSSASGLSDVDTVLRSLVSRVTGLEKSNDSVQEHLEELQESIKEVGENTSIQELHVSNQSDPILLERVEKAEKEISELKQLVIRLQTMLIETTMAAKIAPVTVPHFPSSITYNPVTSTAEETSTGSMILEI